MNKILKDNVAITDSFGPKGFVIIKDKDGNILVKKHNMIVMDGKKYIYALAITGMFRGITVNDDIIGYSNYNLSELRFGNRSAETQYKHSYDENEGNFLKYDISKNDLEFNIGADIPYIKLKRDFVFNSNLENITSIQELELILKSTNVDGTTNHKVFSRIKFDPIPVNASSEFSIEYYIYF